MKAITFKPLGDRVLLKPEATAEKTESGIHIPLVAQGQTQLRIAQVAALGKEVEDKLALGMNVAIVGAAGIPTNLTLKGGDEKPHDYVVIRYSDILSIVE